MELTREITLPAPPEEVWESLAEPAWLGEDAAIDLRPDGDVRAGDRTGFVEEAEEPRRLVFWWSAPGEDATPGGARARARRRTTRSCAWSSRARWRCSTCTAPSTFRRRRGPRQPELLAR